MAWVVEGRPVRNNQYAALAAGAAAAAAVVVVVVVVVAAEEEDRLPSRAGISCADFAVLKVAVNFFTQVTTVHQCLNEGSLLFKFFANRVQLNDTSSKEV